MIQGIITAHDSFGALRAKSELAAVVGIAFEKYNIISNGNSIRRNLPEVIGSYSNTQFSLRSSLEGKYDAGLRSRLELTQNPQRKQARFLGHALRRQIGQFVIRLVTDHFDFVQSTNAEAAPNLVFREKTHLSVDLQFKLRPGEIGK